MSENKERHFCFVYYGGPLNQADFSQLHFSAADGCCFKDKRDDRVIQFVRVSLFQKNGRRAATIPRIIDEYNQMEGRLEKIEPVIFFQQHVSPVICFKARKQSDNPILARIDAAKQASVDGYWSWSSCVSTVKPSRKHSAFTSIDEIVRELSLPVPVDRVHDELNIPYFGKYSIDLDAGGCIPLEHRDFLVTEIRRLFNQELSYIEQPSVGSISPHAQGMLDGVVDDIWNEVGEPTTSSFIKSVPCSSKIAIRVYGKTQVNAMENHGIDAPLGSFLKFYALRWNDAGLDSMCYPIELLHRGWVDAKLNLTDLVHRMGGISPGVIEFKSPMFKVPSVKTLLSLLCDGGLLTPLAETHTFRLSRLSAAGDFKMAACIVDFFQTMLADGWTDEESVQITSTDIVRVFNGGDVFGVYKQACVRQFMRPFLHEGSAMGFTWTTGTGIVCEKFVVDIAAIKASIAKSLMIEKK